MARCPGDPTPTAGLSRAAEELGERADSLARLASIPIDDRSGPDQAPTQRAVVPDRRRRSTRAWRGLTIELGTLAPLVGVEAALSLHPAARSSG